MAIEAVASGAADLVAFGRPFIANPDLVERLRLEAPLAELDRATLLSAAARARLYGLSGDSGDLRPQPQWRTSEDARAHFPLFLSRQ